MVGVRGAHMSSYSHSSIGQALLCNGGLVDTAMHLSQGSEEGRNISGQVARQSTAWGKGPEPALV